MSMIRNFNPRSGCVAFFVLINLVCGIVVWTTRSLVGETSDLVLENVSIVPWITLLVIGSYVFWLVFCFNFFVKFRVKKMSFAGSRYRRHGRHSSSVAATRFYSFFPRHWYVCCRVNEPIR